MSPDVANKERVLTMIWRCTACTVRDPRGAEASVINKSDPPANHRLITGRTLRNAGSPIRQSWLVRRGTHSYLTHSQAGFKPIYWLHWHVFCAQFSRFLCSGGSMITEMRAPTLEIGGPTYYLRLFWPKNAWNWKKVDWEGDTHP